MQHPFKQCPLFRHGIIFNLLLRRHFQNIFIFKKLPKFPLTADDKTTNRTSLSWFFLYDQNLILLFGKILFRAI